MKISSFMSWKTGPFLLSKKTTQSQNTLCGKQSSLKSQGWKFMLFTFLSKSIKNAVWFLTKQHPSAIKASRFWQPWASNLRPCEDIWVHQETFKYSSLVQPLLKHKHKTKCSQYCLKTLDKNVFFCFQNCISCHEQTTILSPSCYHTVMYTFFKVIFQNLLV